ncbi:guanitoxin biosynthesis L-enduracididine beta-hydroxylase GntD [Streptomyces virginiae]|uniref:guanitoxin biosynthesis L-enduracididine beta-hydroxylase GntD n=1 Tax=Streptomyces virginiae TaxID=1961 RepID=UPI0036C7A12F
MTSDIAVDDRQLSADSAGGSLAKGTVFEIQLSPGDVAAVEAIEAELLGMGCGVEDPEFWRQAVVRAQELPRNFREPLNEFRLLESGSVCLISGYPVDGDQLGTTPTHWDRPDGGSSQPAEIFFFLCATLLGEPFGWGSEQGGRIMHDVVPIEGHERLQINSASEVTIWWNNEDAFHPHRADYVGLMCLRNPDSAQTTFASIEAVKLDPAVMETLFEPRYLLRSDESHSIPDRVSDGSPLGELCEHCFAAVEHIYHDSTKSAVLFGDPTSPYLRLDPYFMDRSGEDAEAADALDQLIAAIDENLMGVVALQPGQVLFVDNYRAVHGRKPFKARFDGQDRWLKRLNITRDIRKSREVRAEASSRILF